MGLFDHVTCELPLPDSCEVEKDSFHTKSLWCSMDRFTITRAGRLIFHNRRYTLAGKTDDRGKPRAPEIVANIDMDYHGDIEIHGTVADGTLACYVVRFTHGTVEWIRPFDALTEIHQLWLTERGQ